MGLFNKSKNKQKQEASDKILEMFSQALQDAAQKTKEVGPIILDGQQPDKDDYGLCATNPICVFSLSGTEEYLQRLCTKDGKKFTWSHYTSIRTTLHGLDDIGEDKYTLYLDGKPYADLFFVLYLGQTEFPPAGLYFSDDNRDWDLEREAFGKGVTPEQLLQIRQIEKENEILKKKMQEEHESKELEHKNKLEEDSVQIRKIYPDFDLEREQTNPIFCNLTSLDLNTKIIYEYIHRDELFKKKEQRANNSSISDFTVNYYFRLLCEIENKSKPVIENIHLKSKSELEFEASEHGITVDQLIMIRDMERDNAEVKWNMHIESLKNIAEQAVQTKKLFPDFELSEDWQNETFRKILRKIDMPTAHEYLHFSDYYVICSDEKVSHISSNLKEQKLFCRKCGIGLPLDSMFCHKCGAKVIILDSNSNNHNSEECISNELPTVEEADIYKLALATVNIPDKIAEKNKDSSFTQNDLVSCDTALFCCFIIRAFCLSSANSRDKAIEFSNNYINNIREILNKKFKALNSVLSDMFDNRTSFYDRIFASKNDVERKFRAVLEEYEYIIKTDMISNEYAPFSETSPLPILGIDVDIKIRMEVMKLYDDLPNLVTPYFENVTNQLKK